MTINNLNKFMDGLWDWGILNGCFGHTRITPSDVDGEVERNGHFLTLEAKSPNANIPEGQWIKLFRRVQKGDTVIVVWGEQNKPEKMMVWRPYCSKPEIHTHCDLDKFRAHVKSWFEWANNNGAPSKVAA